MSAPLTQAPFHPDVSITYHRPPRPASAAAERRPLRNLTGYQEMVDQADEKKATIACPFCGKLNRVKVARAGDRPLCGECRKPILMDRPLSVSDENFDRLIDGTDVPVLVDFYADWCGPCKTMAPVLDDLARANLGRAIVLKLDTDRNPRTAARFQISGIPTLVVFRNGREERRQVGAAPRQVLDAMLAGG